MAVVGSAFFDTSILVGGLVEILPGGKAPQTVMSIIARGQVREPVTGWHCCLEFYSVTTRLPPEYRLSPPDAFRLIEEEILRRFGVHQLPERNRFAMLQAVADDQIVGGRIYDTHIAAIALVQKVDVFVTENRRHFSNLPAHGIVVWTASEFIDHVGR